MANVLDEQYLASDTLRCNTKTTNLATGLMTALTMTLSSGIAGASIGIGWRMDEFAFVGVFGFAIFLTVQVFSKSIVACLIQAMITGYLSLIHI